MKKILIIFFMVMFITLLLPLTIVYFTGQMPSSEPPNQDGGTVQSVVAETEKPKEKSE